MYGVCSSFGMQRCRWGKGVADGGFLRAGSRVRAGKDRLDGSQHGYKQRGCCVCDGAYGHGRTRQADRVYTADGGPSEGACEELRSRFLESPHTVLAYLVLMGDQTVSSDDSTPAAEFICGQIASADAAWHDGSEEFAQVMESCKADYPEGPAAELLSKMETAHEASLERNK